MQKIRKHLLVQATKLSGGIVPLDINSISAQLNISIRWRKRLSATAMLIKSDNRHVVCLPEEQRNSSSSDLTPRERFSIAHEIGHLVLDELSDRFHIQLGDKETEALCDEFAAELLLPVSEVRKLASEYEIRHPPILDCPSPPSVGCVKWIARRANVSIRMACNSLSRVFPECLYVCVGMLRGKIGSKNPEAALRVKWSTQSGHCPRGLFRNKRILKGHPLKEAFELGRSINDIVTLNFPPLPYADYPVVFAPYSRDGKDYLLTIWVEED